MHRQLVVRYALALLVLAGLAGPMRLVGQSAPRADALSAIVEAMFFRRGPMADSLPFDACSVWEHGGRPADFPEGVLPGLRFLLDRPAADPCGLPKPSAGSRFERVARVDSVVIADSTARVYVHVRRGEWSYQEVYHLANRPTPGDGWSMREVRMYAPIHVTPPPPRPGGAL